MPCLATKRECTGCMACIDVCSQNALDFKMDDEGFNTISLNSKKCIECKKCEKICPVLSALPENNFKFKNDFYASWSLNEKIRMQSASGGVFAELACTIINNGGIVIGAAMNTTSVDHIAVRRIDELYRIQKSKYLQSNTSGIYKYTKSLLKDGKTVLFSGTPCQVAGLRSFLRDADFRGRLYTAQLVCHGVPSAHILKLFEKITNKKILSINSFRSKESGWRNSHIFKYTEINADEITLSGANNIFSKLYHVDLLLRSSCYDCKFSNIKNHADISLADYWGDVDHVDEHFKGISLLIAHSDLGKELVSKSNIVLHSTTLDKALPLNPRIVIGKNFLHYHPARLLLKFHVCFLSNKLLNKIYCNNMTKYDVYLYPYKLINVFLHMLNKIHKNFILKKVLNKNY